MASLTSAEGYLRSETVKVNKHHVDYSLNKLTNWFAKMHNSEWLNEMEMERKEAEPWL